MVSNTLLELLVQLLCRFDIFPDAGITFWDVAHETNGGLIVDGYTRAQENGTGYCTKWSWNNWISDTN